MRTARAEHGFTLLEVVLSLGVATVLMGALGAAIVLTAQALPNGQAPADDVVAAGEALARMTEELSCAIWFLEHTASAVTFTVPDRDGDGLPERIRYAWSGAAGDPVTREYNDQSSELLAEVQELAFHYDTVATSESYPGPPIESGETLLKNYDSTWNLSDLKVKDDSWWAECFRPSLPGEAVEWGVTRVRFRAKKDGGNSGDTNVQLRLGTDGLIPTDSVLDAATMPESSLGTGYATQEYAFSGVKGLRPDEEACLCFVTNSSSPTADIEHRGSGVSLSNAQLVRGVPAWTNTYSDRAPRFWVYGTYATPGATQTVTRYHMQRVNLRLRVGADEMTQVVSAVHTRNLPEVLSGLWELDFSSSPTADHNGDGVEDWVASKGDFSAGSLAGGVWTVDTILLSQPANDFARLITAEVSFRGTLTGNNGALFAIHCALPGAYLGIVASAALRTDGTQTLTVGTVNSGGQVAEKVRVRGLPTDFIDARLVVDPATSTIAVWAEGQHRRTFVYSSVAGRESSRSAMLYEQGDGAEFDSVSIRVSE